MKRRIDPHAALAGEIRRIAAGEIAKAVADLDVARTRPEKGFHDTRKRLKKLRALFRLVRSADAPFWRAENARLRDIARSLAGAREAAALIETVDRLAEAYPREAAGGRLGPIRAALARRHKHIVNDETGRYPVIDEAVPKIGACLRAIETCAMPDDPEAAADILADGAARTIRRASRALEKAATEGAEADFHELRKAVKDHATHISLLESFWPRPIKSRRKDIGALGERLGELNDLFVLRALMGRQDESFGMNTDIRLLGRLLKRSERKLRKRCLVEASRLFDLGPARLGRKLAGRYCDKAADSTPAG